MSETKFLIAPLQQVLLKKGKCVACLRDLKGEAHTTMPDKQELITCKCGRIYIYTPINDVYRRATFMEAEKINQ